MSVLEDALALQLDLAGIAYEREVRFDPKRRFRFDFTFPPHQVGLEVQGGLWSRNDSGHKHPLGILRDIDKSNLATLRGWRTLHVTGDMIKSGEALRLIQEALE